MGQRLKAVHKDIVLSSWLIEDVEGKAEEMDRVSGEAKRRRKQKWEQRGGGARERVEVNSKRVHFWAVSYIHF